MQNTVLLSICLCISRCIPLEVLHTIQLGACKYFLKHVMPSLSKRQKAEILAQITAFCFSGFCVKVHGNVCYYYKSFVGRDYKAWSQMALFILSPYLGEGERKVLLALSKVSVNSLLIFSYDASLFLIGFSHCIL